MPQRQKLGSRDSQDRVAIVAGLRTPFLKQSTGFRNLSALDLGKLVVSELLERVRVKPTDIEQLVFGQVIPSLNAPNIAREVVLGTSMRRDIDAFSVARACATGYQSTVSVAEAILAGSIDCGIAGGSDSASDIPMTVTKSLSVALMRLSKAKTFPERIEAIKGVSWADVMPVPPQLKELSTGLSMGESAEKMAKENGISREEQDRFAHRSHTLAAKAWQEGKFAGQVMPVHVPPSYEDHITEDNVVRKDSQLEGYAKLKPVFDREFGSVTAGNSSPLTDGASALLLMREGKAKALGLAPLGFIRSYAFSALDPDWQLLMGPALATPVALARAGMELRDIDLIDMHEAFSAQVLSNTQAFESLKFAQAHLGRSTPVGAIDWEKFNVQGGSIALGHPFAATGARQIMQSLLAARERGVATVLCTACAAGGLGAAMVLEVA